MSWSAGPRVDGLCRHTMTVCSKHVLSSHIHSFIPESYCSRHCFMCRTCNYEWNPISACRAWGKTRGIKGSLKPSVSNAGINMSARCWEHIRWFSWLLEMKERARKPSRRKWSLKTSFSLSLYSGFQWIGWAPDTLGKAIVLTQFTHSNGSLIL